jgi:hypothetical protein
MRAKKVEQVCIQKIIKTKGKTGGTNKSNIQHTVDKVFLTVKQKQL